MLRSSLCDYSDVYILVKGTITFLNTGTAAAPDNRNKKLIFKNSSAFTNYLSEINNKEIDQVKDIEVKISMYNIVTIIRKHLEVYGNTIEMNYL